MSLGPLTRIRTNDLRRQPREVKRAPFHWPAFVEGQPQLDKTDYHAFIEDGFEGNPVIYAAIMYKVKAISAAPLRAYMGGAEKPTLLPPDHALTKLVTRPNAFQSWRELQQLLVVYLNVTGNAFIFMDKPNRTALPTALYALRPDRVSILPGRGHILGYRYTAEGRSIYDSANILPDYMMHIKFPNPGDELEGMGFGLSPLASFARNADVDNMVAKFMWNFFKKGAMGMAALEFKGTVDPATIARLRDEWLEIYGGYDEWHRPIVLDNDGHYTSMTPPFKDMGFEQIDGRNESRILGALGVHGMLIGTRSGLERSTFNNYEQAERTFWNNTMIPELKLFEVEYGHYLTATEDTFVRFDTSEVPALQRDIAPIVDAYYKLWSTGVPRDTALAAVGMNMPPTPGGDISYIPVNIMPAGTIENPPPDSSPGLPATAGGNIAPAKPTSAGEGQTGTAEATQQADTPPKKPPKKKLGDGVETKMLSAQATDALTALLTAHEPALRQAAKTAFEADKRHLLALVGEAKSLALEKKSTLDWGHVATAAAVYLAGAGKDGWVTAFRLPLTQLAADTRQTWADLLGKDDGDIGTDWLDAQLDRLAEGIAQTTSTDVAGLLATAAYNGWAAPTTNNAVDALFVEYGAESGQRTTQIATTEAVRFLNGTSNELFKTWAVNRKQWLVEHTPCPFCKQLHNTILPVGEAFVRQGAILDADGQRFTAEYGDVQYPPLHVGCKCLIAPIEGES
jgi:HK97 family phage portal protein